MKHPHRCETCKNGMLYTHTKTKITGHVCSKSPYNSHLLDSLWGYVEQKGCEQWLDKSGKPAVKKTEADVVIPPVKRQQPAPVISPPPHQPQQARIEVGQHGKL